MMNDTMFRMFDLAQKDYCCSQILMCLALECQGRSNGDLVRSMAGLCHGLGHSGDICGALSGGACVLALYAGKGSHSEKGDERLPLMVADLME